MTIIYVDADACPVKDEALRVAARHGLKVVYVSNQWMRGLENPLVEQVVVEVRPDAADDYIAERAIAGDVVVTADIPLAARAIEKGAAALGPDGKAFTPDSIGMALAMRDLMKDLRETGEVSGRNAAYTKADRSRFLDALEALLRSVAKPA